MTARMLPVAIAILISGCASIAQQPPFRDQDAEILRQARGKEESVRIHTDLVRKMISQEKYYAALAHLDALDKAVGESPELQYMRAEALGSLGRNDEAKEIYKKLIEGPFAAEAYHGLGLIYYPGKPAIGIRLFAKAVEYKPTDARMRNDLGYAYLLAGNYAAAREQLATGHELQRESQVYRNNYLLALMLLNENDMVRQVAVEEEMTQQEIQKLRDQASNWQTRQPEPKTSESVSSQGPEQAPAQDEDSSAAVNDRQNTGAVVTSSP